MQGPARTAAPPQATIPVRRPAAGALAPAENRQCRARRQRPVPASTLRNPPTFPILSLPTDRGKRVTTTRMDASITTARTGTRSHPARGAKRSRHPGAPGDRRRAGNSPPRAKPGSLHLSPPKPLALAAPAPYLRSAAERCRSGRTGRSRKPLSLYGDPGFESLSLRHLPPRKRSPDPAAAGFSRCFRGLCGRG